MFFVKDIIDGVVKAIEEFFTTFFKSATEKMLTEGQDIFALATESVREQVGQTPQGFSHELVETMRSISNTAILPIAGVILTYIFCYDIYQMVAEKNKGNEISFEQMMWVILKTALGIKLTTSAFTISLAIIDLGKWIMDRIPGSTMTLPPDITSTVTEKITTPGEGLTAMLLAFVALIFIVVMVGIIFLVAWSRIIVIFLYIAVAPIPFATFFNKDWVGSIAQSYVKNMLALMLQGFFMMMCLVIYSGLMQKVIDMIQTDGNPFYAMTMMVVSMGVLVLSLTKTHTYAKSVVGAI